MALPIERDEMVAIAMGALLSLHDAAEHPHDVSALALYAPSLWLDGWGIPWWAPRKIALALPKQIRFGVAR
jgi:carboxylesterase